MGKCCEIDSLVYDNEFKCATRDYGYTGKALVIVNPTEKTRLPRKEKKKLKKRGISKELLWCMAAVGWHKNKNIIARIDHLGQMIITQYI